MGTLVVLRPDLVVYAPAHAIPIEAARHFADAWRAATDDTVHIVVIPQPIGVIDMRDADPDLITLAERLAALVPVPG